MPTRVFLSSTAKDLSEYRDAVHQAISRMDGFTTVRMEDFGSRDSHPEAYCREQVQECKLLVGIMGTNYGSSPPDSDRSYTEIEYEAAVDAGLPRLMFVAPDNFPLPSDLIEPDERREKQKRFRKRVGEESINDRFDSPDDLAGRVATAIHNVRVKQLSQEVRDGVTALGEIVVETKARESAAKWRAHFELASQQIDVVSQYKDLHDELHNLQFRCYDMLLQESRRPTPEASTIDNYDYTLQEIIGALKDIASRKTVARPDTTWIEDLEQARKELRKYLDESEPSSLKKSLRCLNRVLTVQPSKINERLSHATSSLGLTRLVEVMETLTQQSRELTLDPEKVSTFETGVRALQALNAELHAKASRHARWQRVEDEVRRIENLLNRDLQELEESWPMLKEIAEPLYGDDDDFRKESTSLETALQGGAQIQGEVKRLFHRYRRRVGTRFHDVDRKLKFLCDDMRKVGEPLAAVMEVIQ